MKIKNEFVICVNRSENIKCQKIHFKHNNNLTQSTHSSAKQYFS
jgi:hypothetical protein